MGHPDEDILHQEDVEQVITEHLEEEGNVGANNAAIANANVAHDLNSTFSDTEVETALNAHGTKINAILDVLRANGIIDEA